jgi:hypothetical protein
MPYGSVDRRPDTVFLSHVRHDRDAIPMSSTLEKPNTTAVQLSPEDVRQFLYREVHFLDDKEWENWLALYAPNVEFWMPSWDDDDRLVTDPQTEISLIWYGNKGGLEDRVFRIGTERSGASGAAPLNQVPGAVVSLMDRTNVETVIVAGKVRKWKGLFLNFDLPHLRRQLEASRDYVFAAAGIPQDLFSSQ